MAPKICPLCQKNLSLKQINISLAVYICEDLNCQYPVGYECIVVNRNIENMKKDVSNDQITDCWLDDAIDNAETEQVFPDVDNRSSGIQLNKQLNGVDADVSIDSCIEEKIKHLRHNLHSDVDETKKDSVEEIDMDDILEFLNNIN